MASRGSIAQEHVGAGAARATEVAGRWSCALSGPTVDDAHVDRGDALVVVVRNQPEVTMGGIMAIALAFRVYAPRRLYLSSAAAPGALVGLVASLEMAAA